jgi:hypothetical protein
MRLMMEFGALAGAGWFASNVFLVGGWCWLRARRKHRIVKDHRSIIVFQMPRSSYLGMRRPVV